MILVTGANGFVGRQVVRALQSQRKSLRIVVRESSNLATEFGELSEIVETPDLFRAEPAWWAQVLKGVKTVVHLA